ncbi:MAG: peptidase M15 [Alphaproteobacteria bacterium]|nr:MAG: peptidase M15 [Alphaproteobacteria bacterium]
MIRHGLVGVLMAISGSMVAESPKGFVDLAAFIPDATIEARYAGHENFMGRPVDGYHANKAFLSLPAAMALKAVAADLAKAGMTLKIYDAYRPQRAVDDFMRWCADTNDTARKETYYPTLTKDRLVPEGYIAEKSGHSRGSTVDLTILKDGVALDMGSPWDFFCPVSNVDAPGLSATAIANRQLLRAVMLKHGFKPYEAEWWHFTLADEPYPDTYFDFPVE